MRMKDKDKLALLALLLLGTVTSVGLFLLGNDVAILNPAGEVADKQRGLIITATLLMLVVVIPVFFMTFFFAWKYRESNTKAKYTPDWDHHRIVEISWWAIPGVIILILGVLIWRSSHQLDPFKPLSSTRDPVTIQVVALQWKWLFIYPDQNIATVNYLQIPEDTPINFEITADAPMNSFWIPRLGGQVYAMAGMKTKLHLMANQPGSFNGSSANLSGEGFSRMTFVAKATSAADFEDWVRSVKTSPEKLSQNAYDMLAEPGESDGTPTYSSTEPGLHSKVVMKYMAPVAEEGGEDRYNKSNHKVH